MADRDRRREGDRSDSACESNGSYLGQECKR